MALESRDAFDRLERRGDGQLHVAFEALRANERHEAARLLDAAVAAGAPMRECARLRWMLADDQLRSEVRDERAMRALEKASAAFERELARDPDAVASRVAVRLRLASARAQHLAGLARPPSSELARVESDLREVTRWVVGTWMDGVPMRSSIDRARARWHVARGEHDRARAIVDAALEADPADHGSWQFAMELAHPEERESLRRRATEATSSASPARHMAARSPGGLALRVLEARLDALTSTLTEVATHARELPPRTRALLGMGIAAILSTREASDEVVTAFLGLWLDAPDAHPTWIAEAFLRERWERGFHLVRPFLPTVDPKVPSSATALADLAVVAAGYESPSAHVLLGTAALPLTPNELTRVRRPYVDEAFRSATARADEAHDALHPELCLATLDEHPSLRRRAPP